MQITTRDTKDCFYLYEVLPSGPHIPRSFLELLDDETWDVVDSDDIESWVSQDLLKKCGSFELVSELFTVRLG